MNRTLAILILAIMSLLPLSAAKPIKIDAKILNELPDPYTVAKNDTLLVLSATTNNHAVILPSAAANPGRMLMFVARPNYDLNAGSIIIQTQGSDVIDTWSYGEVSQLWLNGDTGASVTLVSDGRRNWDIVS